MYGHTLSFPIIKQSLFAKLKHYMFTSSFVFNELGYEPQVFYFIQKHFVTMLSFYFSLYLIICVKTIAKSFPPSILHNIAILFWLLWGTESSLFFLPATKAVSVWVSQWCIQINLHNFSKGLRRFCLQEFCDL